MGWFSKIKNQVKNITKSAAQEAKESRELAESVAKDAQDIRDIDMISLKDYQKSLILG